MHREENTEALLNEEVRALRQRNCQLEEALRRKTAAEEKLRLFKAVAVHDRQGRFVPVNPACERQQMAEKLRQQKIFLESVLEAITHPLYVIDANDYTVIMANSAAKKIYGSPQSATTCYALTHHAAAPCCEPGHPCPLAGMKQHRTPVIIEHVHREGSGASRTVEVHAYPIVDSQGKMVQMVEYTVDISERKRMEAALKEREQLHREAQQLGKIGHWTWNRETSTLVWSDEVYRIFGVQPGAFKPSAEAFEATIHPDDREDFLHKREAMLREHQKAYIEHRIVCPDGTVRHVAERTELETDKHGEVRRVLGTVQDITERKQMEERLQAALEEKEVLMREVLHRTKNNMSEVISLLSLQSNGIKDEAVLQIFQDLRSRIQTLTLVQQKLYLSENLAHLDLKDYLKDLAYSVFYSYQKIPSQISLTFDSDSVIVSPDTAIPCGMVLNELLTNCLKHAFPENRPGEIQVTLHREKNENIIELRVSDNGIGLSDDIECAQADSLGLKLITSFVRQLHGTLKLTKKNGSEFRIRMPNSV